MFSNKSIGQNIKKFRLQKNLSQNDLAIKLAVTRQTISNYETGRSNPDIYMLYKISTVLNVDLSYILYGSQTHSIDQKKASIKRTLILLIAFAALFFLTLFLYFYTYHLRLPYYNFTPYILVRLLLIPFVMIFLGILILQIFNYFIGVKTPSNKLVKIGRNIIIGFLIFNIIIILPKIMWLLYGFFKKLTGITEIHMTFPYIQIYTEISFFFDNLMYNYSFVYIFIGMALWIFILRKKLE